MLKKALEFCNDNHWYIIALISCSFISLWVYGCESQVCSLLDNDLRVNRQELKVELEYISGIASARVSDLNKQDEIKQSIFDAIMLVSQGGQINSMGVLNLVATIGAISFGLNRNQKYRKAIGNPPTS